MSDLKRRVTKLEAAVPAGEIRGPLIFLEGESPEATLARYGLTSEDIEGRFILWLPDNGRDDG